MSSPIFSEFEVNTAPVGKTPLRMGVNVEYQPRPQQANLWDWLKDSGAQILREFHPERSLRKANAPTKRWDACDSRPAFEDFRAELVRDPDNAVPWETYCFDQEVKWLGRPEEIIAQSRKCGFESICSLGWSPKDYPHPLVVDFSGWEQFTAEDDALIDWRAAASAWEYFFAEIFRFAGSFGVTRFSTYNEPEWCEQFFYLPEDLEGGGLMTSALTGQRPDLFKRVAGCLAMQIAVMARLARMAADDVTKILAERTADSPVITLIGPTSPHLWKPVWKHVQPYLDVCNYHVYAVSPDIHKTIHRNAEHTVKPSGKRVAISEFNLKGGPTRPEESFFNFDQSLKIARVLLQQLRMPAVDGPLCDFTTFYHFYFPATHRNYKSLVFGDMNLMDWTGGEDRPLRDRGDGWYPSFEECQIRHATPAYDIFRMIARCTPAANGSSTPFPVHLLNSPILYGGDEGQFASIESAVVVGAEQMFINLLNLAEQPAHTIHLNLQPYVTDFPWAVLRITDQKSRDSVIQVWDRNESDVLKLDLPACSFAQVRLLKTCPWAVDSLRIEEETFTAGSLQSGLELHQTTRLRAIGTSKGVDSDFTDVNIIWQSSDPEAFPITQTGLVLCQRASASATKPTFTATLLRPESSDTTKPLTATIASC